ncbi:hypothetical protein ACFL3Z_02515 [Gemmatimonadota bacterium]
MMAVAEILASFSRWETRTSWFSQAVQEVQKIQLGQVFSATTVEEVMFATGSSTGVGRATLPAIKSGGTGTSTDPEESE